MKIKKIIFLTFVSLILLVGCQNNKNAENVNSNKSQGLAQREEMITIIDSVGREVTLPKIAERVVLENPLPARLYTYVNGTNNVVGVSPREQHLDGRPYALANPDIAEIKTFSGNNNIENYEEVLLEKPDVFFVSNKKDASDYDKIQEQVGCPVIALDGGRDTMFDEKTYESIRIIGKSIGKEKRAEEVVNYMESIKEDLYQRTKDIPEEEVKTAYAGGLAYKGAHGIEGTRGNYQLFDAVNVKNVVKTEKDGLVEVDKEKLIEWSPEFIFIDLASISLIQEEYNKNPQYFENLNAFKNDKVYAQLPFIWCQINYDTALADAYFVGKTCYPDKFEDIDVVDKANEIYEFLVGKGVYEELANEVYGGFQKLQLDDFANNKFMKVEK